MLNIIYRTVGSLGVSSETTNRKFENVHHVLKVGLVGASNIAGPAMIAPAKYSGGKIVVNAVATRNSLERAQKYATKFKIPHAFGSYSDMLKSAEINCVYIGNANGDHYKVAIEALRAKKHVLCEKPIASNERETKHMMEEAEKNGVVLMEAAHVFHHPSCVRFREIVRSGELGEIKHVKIAISANRLIFKSDDIRKNNKGKNPELAGGFMMDFGVYGIHMARYATDTMRGEADVISAKAVELYPETDIWMDGKLKFKKTIDCEFSIGLCWNSLFSATVTVTGAKGEASMSNFMQPHMFHSIDVRSFETKKSRREKVYVDGGEALTTYEYQALQFAKAVEANQVGLIKSSVGGAVDEPDETMRVIDSIYVKAGMNIRNGNRPLVS